MVEAISNSGPLIHLAQIEKFELLNVFSKIYIPEEGFKEVCTAGKQGEKELKKAEKALSDLYNVSSLFVTKAIIDEAIEELRKFTQR